MLQTPAKWRQTLVETLGIGARADIADWDGSDEIGAARFAIVSGILGLPDPGNWR